MKFTNAVTSSKVFKIGDEKSSDVPKRNSQMSQFESLTPETEIRELFQLGSYNSFLSLTELKPFSFTVRYNESQSDQIPDL